MNQTALQQRINQRNRHFESARKKQFVTRASDTQILNHLARVARIAVEDWKSGVDVAQSMRDLESFLKIAEKRAQ